MTLSSISPLSRARVAFACLLGLSLFVPVITASAQSTSSAGASFIAIDTGAIIPERVEFFVRPSLAGNMIGGRFEASDSSVSGNYEVIHSILSAPNGGANSISVSTTKTYRYFRYVAPSIDSVSIATFEVSGAVPATPAPQDTGASFVAIDTGTIVPESIEFFVRASLVENMVGGRFEASATSVSGSYEVIHVISSAPSEGLNRISVSTDNAYRYYRYVAPSTDAVSIASFEVNGEAPVQPVPQTSQPDPEPQPTPEAEPQPTAPSTPEPAGFSSTVVNGRTVFGLDPAWATGREFDKALDGDVNTFYDYREGATIEGFVGFDNGSAATASSITFTPRSRFASRMRGGRFEGSNESPYSGYETIYEFTEAPAVGEQTVTVSEGEAYRYFRYISPLRSYGNIAEFSINFDSVAPTPPVPSIPEPAGFSSTVVNGRTVFGLDPAWATGREFDKVFDGDANTFYDYREGATVEGFVGFDNESAATASSITFTPRSRFTSRMRGGRFQGSNESPYSGYETIYEFTEAPAVGEQTVTVQPTKAYRYFRFISPIRSYGNIAELSVNFGSDGNTAATPTETETEAAPPAGQGEFRSAVVNGRTVFGLDPARSAASSFEKVFDGNANTFYDYLNNFGSEGFVGFDNGTAAQPGEIVFTARGNGSGKDRNRYANRMIGTKFQGSNESAQSGYETIYEFTEPARLGEQSVSVNSTKAYRYFRYLFPVRSYSNIAEFSINFVEPVEEPTSTIEPEPEEETPVPTPIAVPPAPRPQDVEPINIESPTPGVTKINFSLATSGQVSGAIYDSDERLIRTLLRGEELGAGQHSVIWDGLDRNGDAVDAGDYTFKLLRSDGLRSEFITNFGINPDSSPYDTWVGTHEGGASSVAVDSTGVYIAAEITETAPVVIKQSLDGSTRLWSKERIDVTEGRFQGGTAMAADGNGTLYMLQQNGRLQVIDGATGNLRASWDVLPRGITRGNELFFYIHAPDSVSAADVAARGSTIAISYRESNTVSWINPANGSVTSSTSLSSPRGLAVAANGEVLVISEDKLYGLRPGSNRIVIDGGFEDAQRITVDTTNNTLLVAFGIEGSQVKRYAMNGSVLDTYGRSGGRLEGAYVAEDFYSIRDITADGQGGFFVTEPESQPRRIARMDTNGGLIDEWYGGQDYYAWAEPDPRIAGSAWLYLEEGFLRADIDLETGEWEVAETWTLKGLADGLINDIRGQHGRWNIVYRGDDRYLISEVIPQVLVHKNDGTLRAVSISSSHAGQLERAMTMAGETGSPDSFRWLDANGDGRPQRSEFTFSRFREVPIVNRVNPDFSTLGYDRPNDSFDVVKSEALWSELGPYYPIGREGEFNKVVASTPVEKRAGTRGSNVFNSVDGDYYGHYLLDIENHGVYWPTHWGSVSRFVKWDEDGNELWSVGRHAYHGGLAGTHDSTYVETPAGQLHVPVRVIGEFGDKLVLADRVENPGMVWSKDGLFVGSLFDRRADDGLPDEVYSWFLTPDSRDAITTSDNASGGKLISYDDGTVLWFTQGRNSVPVYRVTGWDDDDRQEIDFSLSSKGDVAAEEGSGLVAQFFRGEIDDTPNVQRTDAQVWYGFDDSDDVIDGADGALYDWSGGPEGLGQSTNFTARWKGEIEAPLTEEFIFSVYARGGARLWVNGEQIIFSWNEITDKVESQPVQLEAGKRYAVQLDFNTTNSKPAVSLNWESLSLDRSRIPSRYLYPVDSAEPLEQLYDARSHINAADYDVESGHMENFLVDEFAVSGLGQRGIGRTGAYLGYSPIDFGEGTSALVLQAGASPSRASDTYPINLAFRLGSPSGPNIAEVNVRGGLRTIRVDTSAITGVQDIYIINTTSDDRHRIELRWFRFE